MYPGKDFCSQGARACLLMRLQMLLTWGQIPGVRFKQAVSGSCHRLTWTVSHGKCQNLNRMRTEQKTQVPDGGLASPLLPNTPFSRQKCRLVPRGQRNHWKKSLAPNSLSRIKSAAIYFLSVDQKLFSLLDPVRTS